MAPSSYFNRNLPGSPYFRFPVASLRLHGKVAWNDFDQVSYKYFDKLREDPGLKQWEYQMGLTKTAEEFVWMNRREVGMGLTQGVQSANFDIHGGYYEDPVILAGVAQLNRIRTQATRKDQRASAAEILVLVDEESEHYLSFRNPVTTRLLGADRGVGFRRPLRCLAALGPCNGRHATIQARAGPQRREARRRPTRRARPQGGLRRQDRALVPRPGLPDLPGQRSGEHGAADGPPHPARRVRRRGPGGKADGRKLGPS